jgi:glycosyltransferase involved in cell wall biosynthesis
MKKTKKKLASLTFGFSTLESRLKNIELPDLSQHPDWDVLITVQSGTDQIADISNAPKGTEVLSFAGKGVTKLRNAVLDSAQGKYLVFADDDITFNLEGLEQAIAHLESTDTALALCQAVTDKGVLRKSYPTQITKLTKFNSARAATYEMIVNLEKVRAAGVRFDENFGAGAEITYLGDEYIFICDLIDKGLTCEFLPITVATHPEQSSGSGWGSDLDRVARAKIFDRAFKGTSALPYLVRIAFGARKLGKELSLKNYLKFIFKK